ncbi:MAG TPA: hypothetical protein VHJ82_03280 [Actinomycetota bacterium]|nr:hypothetical protein [Actinomycetota bacterium]
MRSVTEAELRYLVESVGSIYNERLAIDDLKMKAVLRIYPLPPTPRRVAAAVLDQTRVLLHEAPLSRRNGEWAVAVACLFARKQGQALRLSDDDASSLIRRAQERHGTAATVAWIARRLEELSDADSQLGFFERPEAGPSRPAVKAYIVSALTALDEPDRKWVIATSEEAATALRKLGIEVHQPVLVTDPVDQPGIEATRVHAVDYAAVLDSDLLVVLGNYPSWGGGKEIAWGEANGCAVVLIMSTNRRLSRLVSGSSRGLAVLPDTSGIAGALTEYVEAKRASLEAHAEKRLLRDVRFAPILDALRNIAASKAPLPPPFGITASRLQELAASSNHVANGTIEELADLARDLSLVVSLGEWIEVTTDAETRKPRRGPVIESGEFDALRAAIRIHGPAPERVVSALEKVLIMRSSAVKRRDPLNSAEDWAPFLESP